MTENERIAQVRKKENLTMEKFGSRIGITKGAVSLIESGKNAISNTTRLAICREFGVSEEWLRNGIGGDEIVFERTANDAAAAFAKENGLENIEEVLLREYLQLEDKERETFRKYLKNVLRDLYGADPAKEAAASPEIDEPIIADTPEEREMLLEFRRQKEEIASAG